MTEQQDGPQPPRSQQPVYTGVGIALGAGLGIALGQLVFNNLSIGLAIGIALGLVIGAALDARHRRNPPRHDGEATAPQ